MHAHTHTHTLLLHHICMHTKRKIGIYCRQEVDPIFQLSLAEYKYKLDKDDKGQLERGK